MTATNRTKKEQRFGFRATLHTACYALMLMARHQPSFLFYLFAAGLFEAAKPFVAVFLPKLVLDEIAGGRDPLRLALLAVLAAVLSGLLYWVGGLLALRRDRENDKFDQLTDKLMGEKTLKMDYPYLESPETLTLIQQFRQGRMTQGGFSGAFGWALRDGLPAFLTMVGMLWVVLRMEIWVLGSIVVTVGLTLLILRRQMDAQNRATLRMGDTNRVYNYLVGLTIDFSYAKDVRLYDAQSMLTGKITNTLGGMWESVQVEYRTQAHCRVVQAMLSQAQMALIYAALVAQAVLHGLSIGDFVLYSGAAVSFTGALLTTAISLMNVYSALRLIAPYTAYMHLPDLLRRGREPVPTATEEAAVVFENVCFTYPHAAHPTLQNLHLTLRRGEKLAIVGENGAGKTTLIKLLLRLYDPDSGRITLNGRDISALDRDAYLDELAVVFQDFKLLAFSVRENLCIGEGEEERMRDALAKAGMKEAVDACPRGAETSIYRLFDEEGVEFSGGERQKLAIARALYKDSPIVVMDEPTAALDPIAEAEVYGRLNDLIQDKTAIFISHRLSSCKFCDRVAVMENGAVTQLGSHEELLATDGLYRRMFDAQAQYYV